MELNGTYFINGTQWGANGIQWGSMMDLLGLSENGGGLKTWSF